MKMTTQIRLYLAVASLTVPLFSAIAQTNQITKTRQAFQGRSAALLQLADQAYMVAYVTVTNIPYVDPTWATVLGDRKREIYCVIKEVLKGPTNETSIIVDYLLIKHQEQRISVGSDYLVFLTRYKDYNVRYYLTDHWLSFQPYDNELIHELRDLFGKSQSSVRTTTAPIPQNLPAGDVSINIK